MTRQPSRRRPPGLLLLLVAPVAGEELRERSQALLDAAGTGDVEIWDSYLDPRAIYVKEAGEVLTKPELHAEIRPLPDRLQCRVSVIRFWEGVSGRKTGNIRR